MGIADRTCKMDITHRQSRFRFDGNDGGGGRVWVASISQRWHQWRDLRKWQKMYYFETFERKRRTKQGSSMRRWSCRARGVRTEGEEEREKNDSVLFSAFEMTKQNCEERENEEVKLYPFVRSQRLYQRQWRQRERRRRRRRRYTLIQIRGEKQRDVWEWGGGGGLGTMRCNGNGSSVWDASSSAYRR